MLDPEDGGSTCRRNVGESLPELHPGSVILYGRLGEPQILLAHELHDRNLGPFRRHFP
jgi:hypothetical protein